MTDDTWHDWHGGDHPDIPWMAAVRVIYRGPPSRPAPAIRIPIAAMVRFDWSHDGGPDDIVKYQIAEVPL